jgi:hypothetical protein
VIGGGDDSNVTKKKKDDEAGSMPPVGGWLGDSMLPSSSIDDAPDPTNETAGEKR